VTTTGRAFVAVVPPPAVLDALDAAVAAASRSVSDVRWAAREQRHVTLQFLGNHVQLDAVASALDAVAESGGVVRLGGGGAFPNPRRGAVLWAGVTEGADVLARLAGRVAAAVAPLGFEPEFRDYHAHLTLARLKKPRDLRAVVEVLDASALGPAWSVDEVLLFRSHTRREGAVYEVVARFPLAPGDHETPPVG
jgi:2'-5' RNA ligase